MHFLKIFLVTSISHHKVHFWSIIGNEYDRTENDEFISQIESDFLFRGGACSSAQLWVGCIPDGVHSLLMGPPVHPLCIPSWSPLASTAFSVTMTKCWTGSNLKKRFSFSLGFQKSVHPIGKSWQQAALEWRVCGSSAHTSGGSDERTPALGMPASGSGHSILHPHPQLIHSGEDFTDIPKARPHHNHQGSDSSWVVAPQPGVLYLHFRLHVLLTASLCLEGSSCLVTSSSLDFISDGFFLPRSDHHIAVTTPQYTAVLCTSFPFPSLAVMRNCESNLKWGGYWVLFFFS